MLFHLGDESDMGTITDNTNYQKITPANNVGKISDSNVFDKEHKGLAANLTLRTLLISAPIDGIIGAIFCTKEM
jgi:hypothetical protein